MTGVWEGEADDVPPSGDSCSDGELLLFGKEMRGDVSGGKVGMKGRCNRAALQCANSSGE